MVGPITAPLAPVAVNAAVNVSASFTDPLPTTTHMAVWNWGDGTTSAGTVTEANGSGTATGSHAYTVDGVYTVTLTVANPQGGSAQSSFQYVVVYNPNGGFVTGGGWITSPTGAYVANPLLTDKTSFGIDVKYHSGSSAPTGNTDFQLPTASLDFESTSYAWLTISGTMAQYHGTGTINGAGSYGFIVTVTDGDLLGGTAPDTFRIRIWNSTQGNGTTSAGLIYDNEASAPIYNSPSVTTLGGGKITIHKSNQTTAGGPGPHPAMETVLTLDQLRPLVTEAITRWQEAGATPGQVSPLQHFTLQIVSLPPGILAMTGPGIIWISPDADGYGWFIDPNSADDSAFTGVVNSLAGNRMDLLSVMAHELGHLVLGMDESAQPNDVRTEALPLGVRRLPTPYDLGLQPSAAWASSHTDNGLRKPHAMANQLRLMMLDALFASGMETKLSVGLSPTPLLFAPTSNPALVPLTARKADGWLRNRQLLVASVTAHRGLFDKGIPTGPENDLEEGLLDSLARGVIR